MSRAWLSVLAILTAASGGCDREYTPYRTALLGTRPAQLDPVGLAEINSVTLMGQICSRLTSVDDSLNLSGDAAEGWEVSEHGTLFRFSLRQGRKFHNGDPVTAQDIVFSFDRLSTRDQSIRASWVRDVKSIRATNSSTVEIMLRHTAPSFLYRLSHPTFCILDHAKPFLVVGGASVPNSSGAYRIVATTSDSFLLAVSGNYASIAKEPQIQVVYRNQAQAIADFDAGKLDDLHFYLLNDDEISTIHAPHQVYETKFYWSWLLSANPRRPEFATAEQRRMFFSQIDADALVRSWATRLTSSRSIIPAGVPGHVENSAIPAYNARGKVPCKGEIIATLIEGVPSATLLQTALRAAIAPIISCKLRIQVLEMNKFEKDYAEGKSDLYFAAVSNQSMDPLSYYRNFAASSSENLLHYSNSLFDSLYSRLMDMAQDKRKSSDYADIHRSLYNAGYALVLGSPYFRFVFGDEVESIALSPIGFHLNKWWQLARRRR